MNAYGDLVTLKCKAYLGIDTTEQDTELLGLLENASRLLDKETHRFFYCRNEIRYYDGAGTILLLSDDLLSITTLETDEDGDATYENSLATTDYFLYPLNDFPKTRIEINPNGDYSHFANGIQKGVKITGIFGYGEGESATPYVDSGATSSEVLDTTETGVDVSDISVFAPGQTILIDSEQMYLTAVDTDLKVKRGVNGTTAATHVTSSTIYIYEYPQPIVQACLIDAMRAWKRKDSAYQDAVGSPETGMIIRSKGVDPDVARMIQDYRRKRYF